MSQLILARNRKLLNQLSPTKVEPWSCRAQNSPVEGKWKQEGTIYQATVTHKNPATVTQETKTYLGLAATIFYQRHQNHTTSFTHRDHITTSELSKHILKLKDSSISFNISWKILDRAQKFSPISKSWKLCTLERYYLLCRPELNTLNKNKEFSDECLHKRVLKLSNVKWKPDQFSFEALSGDRLNVALV